MTALRQRIAQIIAGEGPITVERYWNLALFDPNEGYYAIRDPFGRGGDFTTAPEISQMFGELIGAWLVAAWRALGAPSPFALCEAGPGRGTLMADILRTIRGVDPSMLRAARVTLIETSDRLAAMQAERLAVFDLPVRHRKRIEETEALPMLLVANELFDAVAIRQFVNTHDGWRERRIGLDGERLRFVEAEAEAGAVLFLSRIGAAPVGSVFEASPQRVAIADAIAERIAANTGAALLIDYGHATPGLGDTLQAVRGHRFADPLAEPGRADITSHVDFTALAARFARRGLRTAPIAEQGDFLLSLGLRERAGAMGANRNEAEQARIVAVARRLAGTDENEMGRLFKVLATASNVLPLPPFAMPLRRD